MAAMQAIANIAMAAALAWLLLPGSTRAAEGQDACVGQITVPYTVIRSSGTWCMTKNEGFRVTTPISVQADNVTIDCKGFVLSLVGPAGARSYGALESTRANLTVRNCTFKGFGIGTSVTSPPDVVIDHNTFDRSAVYLDAPSGVVRDNVFRDTELRVQRSIDIIDNTFVGLDPYDGSGGMRVVRSNASIRGNRIAGGANMRPWGGVAKVRDNVLTGTGTGIAIDCLASSSNPVRLKDNVITGFATATRYCGDAGGNVVKP